MRVALRYGAAWREEDQSLPEVERRQKSRERMLAMPDEERFDVRWVQALLPGQARIFKSVRCSQCGEGVMEARAHLRDGQPYCAGAVHSWGRREPRRSRAPRAVGGWPLLPG